MFGTGFVVADHLVDSLITFQPINERICYIRFKGNWYNHSFISAYAPTEEHDEDDKDAFYDDLESNCERPKTGPTSTMWRLQR